MQHLFHQTLFCPCVSGQLDMVSGKIEKNCTYLYDTFYINDSKKNPFFYTMHLLRVQSKLMLTQALANRATCEWCILYYWLKRLHAKGFTGSLVAEHLCTVFELLAKHLQISCKWFPTLANNFKRVFGQLQMIQLCQLTTCKVFS